MCVGVKGEVEKWDRHGRWGGTHLNHVLELFLSLIGQCLSNNNLQTKFMINEEQFGIYSTQFMINRNSLGLIALSL